MTSRQRFAVRITRDAYCLQLIEKLQKPLATMAASINPEVPAPAGFGYIRSDIIEQVDYVARHRHRDPATDNLSVMIELDDSEEVHFLRE
jgi:tRNA A37 threonylcarbamoyladenosine synthetase subunit TsaC/SUA5/YrdC